MSQLPQNVALTSFMSVTASSMQVLYTEITSQRTYQFSSNLRFPYQKAEPLRAMLWHINLHSDRRLHLAANGYFGKSSSRIQEQWDYNAVAGMLWLLGLDATARVMVESALGEPGEPVHLYALADHFEEGGRTEDSVTIRSALKALKGLTH